MQGENLKQDNAKNPRWTRYTVGQVGGWPGGWWSSKKIMPSLAFPTGLSSRPSVAIKAGMSMVIKDFIYQSVKKVMQ